MGLTAIVSSSASSASAGVSSTVTSLMSPVGLGVGGVFVATALVFALAYLNLLDASEQNVQRAYRLALAVSAPLVIAFTGIVAFQTLQFL